MKLKSFKIITVFLLGFCLVSYAQVVDVKNSTVTDIDGNVYATIKIGKQVWTVENLRTTKLNDGTPIPLVTVGTDWNDLKTPGYCYYNNVINADHLKQYGALYNWYAVNTKMLAPKGWHVPSEAEWQIMIDFLGGNEVAGGKMKAKGTIENKNGLWSQPNTAATNESGFSAYPNGGRFYVDYGNIDYLAYFWTSSKIDKDYSWGFNLHFKTSEIYPDQYAFKYNGYSVRCVRDDESTGTVSIIQSAGDSNNQSQKSFTDSRDGKVYKTVTIGTQTWMAENLAYKADSCCWAYNNDDSNVSTYGYLYDWGTAKAVCPKGWHLPSDDEWSTLTDYLGGESVAGEKMKSKTGWYYSGNGTNTSGFSALPVGNYNIDGSFINFGYAGYWWSSTEKYTFELNAGYWSLYYDSNKIDSLSSYQKDGFSVRCIRDL